MTEWGTEREQEIRRRILVSVAAYAYEIANEPLMSDATFDYWAERVDRHRPTGHPLLDEFFIARFTPMTGMWIHEHPELAKVAATYERYYANVVIPLNLRTQKEHANG